MVAIFTILVIGGGGITALLLRHPRPEAGPATAMFSTSAWAGPVHDDPDAAPEPLRTSVLGWKHLRLLSVVCDGGWVILGCRRRPPGGSRGGEAAGDVPFGGDDRTIVLRLGPGVPAAEAIELLGQWETDGTWLRIRPAPVPGALELADDHGRACLRAPLVAV
jgi:hypothetical protein